MCERKEETEGGIFGKRQLELGGTEHGALGAAQASLWGHLPCRCAYVPTRALCSTMEALIVMPPAKKA